jgi:hypothetical protein
MYENDPIINPTWKDKLNEKITVNIKYPNTRANANNDVGSI